MSESPADDLAHCVGTIRRLIEGGGDDRRGVLQLGYNLGRLSELTGRGRRFWDDWKGPVAAWDREALRRLADRLGDPEEAG
jgi:hypothetical protein